MRKIRGILAVLLLSVSITGCSNKNDEQQQGNLTLADEQTEVEKQDIPKTDEELEENIVKQILLLIMLSIFKIFPVVL